VLFVSFGDAFSESNPSSFLLCCVVDGLIPSNLELFGDLLRVLEPPLVLLPSFGAPSSESNPPFLLCCVVNGILPSGLELPGVLPCVLEPPLVVFLSLGATSNESNPLSFPSLLCC
jgi:hypothetical protein